MFGDVVYNLYGSTEVAIASVATPEDWKRAPGTVGRSPVGCTVRLYDDAGRRVTAPDTIGRVFVGSGLKFAGYTGGGSKEEIGGLLSSGDVGHFAADGLLFIDGRTDEEFGQRLKAFIVARPVRVSKPKTCGHTSKRTSFDTRCRATSSGLTNFHAMPPESSCATNWADRAGAASANASGLSGAGVSAVLDDVSLLPER